MELIIFAQFFSIFLTEEAVYEILEYQKKQKQKKFEYQ